MKLSFIILSRNSEQYIRKCLLAVQTSCHSENITDYEIILLDNNSADQTIRIVKKLHLPNLRLLQMTSNLGTTRPRNLGFKQARGEFLCILDADTEIRKSDFSGAFAHIQKNPRVGILAPRLILQCGAVQHSVKKFPTGPDKLKSMAGILLRGSLSGTDHYCDFSFDSVREVDTAISACWILPQRTVTQIGLLDENIFYAPEDVDYCLRLNALGKKVVYYPFFEIVHHTQQVSHKRPFSFLSLSHVLGLAYYFKKHRYFFSREKLYARLKNGCEQQKMAY